VAASTYDGATHTGGSGTVTGAGGLNTRATSLIYTGNQVNAGTYFVTAHYAGDANHLPSDGAAVAVLILKATPTVTVTGGTFAFDGAAHPASAVVTGVGRAAVSGSLTFTYNGSTSVPTKAGTYAVVATFISTDPNYNGATGSATLTILSAKEQIVLIIDQVNALVSSNQLNEHAASGLRTDLNSAIIALDRGDTTGAIDQLSAFILRVKAIRKSGQLKKNAAQRLIDAARIAIVSVQQEGNGTPPG
jgi:hypothetical protein